MIQKNVPTTRHRTKNGTVYRLHDSTLEAFDIGTLRGHDCLSDRAVHFFITYFYAELPSEKAQKVEVLSPEVVQLVKLSTSTEVTEILRPLNLETKDLVIMPVNDHVASDESGGSHWSLLLYARSPNSFYHYDSLNDSNYNHALTVSQNIREALNCNGYPYNINCVCSQQRNAIDCGIYVILYCRKIFKIYLENEDVIKETFMSIETGDSMNRHELLSILNNIEKYSEEKI